MNENGEDCEREEEVGLGYTEEFCRVGCYVSM